MSVHYDQIKLSISFSLSRKVIAGLKTKAALLGVSKSAYVSSLLHNDLIRGRDAPLELLAGKEKLQKTTPKTPLPPRGVEVDLSDF